jgi:DNA ligase-1
MPDHETFNLTDTDQFLGLKLVSSWIYELEQSNSRIQKKKTIEKALMAANLGSASAQCFLFNCYQAYNPFYVFNIRQVPETKNLVDCVNPWFKFWSLCESLRTKSITGNTARHQIEQLSQEFDSQEWNNLARRVLLKDLRCGITEKTLNEVLANTRWAIPNFGCQLANDQQKLNKNLKGSRRLEVKLDGVRVLAIVTQFDDVQLLSRNGKLFPNFAEIEQEIINHVNLFKSQNRPFEIRGSFVLDGEIVGENFQQLMKQAHRKYNTQTTDMKYYIFDIIPLDAFINGRWDIPQQSRCEFLSHVGRKIDQDKKIKIMPGLTVDFDQSSAREILTRFTDDALANGHEGVMIKDTTASYISSRNNNWIKWKPVESFDLVIVDFEKGTGRNQDRLGALICEGTDNGRTIHVNVGSGLTDQQREEFWHNRTALAGQIVEIQADAITQNQDGTYSLRFPRFHRFRDDK